MERGENDEDDSLECKSFKVNVKMDGVEVSGTTMGEQGSSCC
jgi:hypothetical protein